MKTVDQIRDELPERELREGVGLEVRAKGNAPKIGLFIPFESRSLEMFGFTEIIAPGAFRRSIANGKRARDRGDRTGDIKALWQHNPAIVLGRQANGTLELRETAKGLDAEILLNPAIDDHRRALDMIDGGLVDGSSFGFEVTKESWNEDTMTRTLEEVKLFEVSPVTFPAYPRSQSEMRSWLDRIGRNLPAIPPAPVPPVEPEHAIDWAARLALRMRNLNAA